MKLIVFQSDKGDCLLLKSAAGFNLLVDGGMAASYSKHAAPFLGKMAEREEHVDLVYVSHIDQDHISGILRMVDDAVDWKVFKYQKGRGNTSFKEPKSHRPPQIKGIWHNAFFDRTSKNKTAITKALAANGAALSASKSDKLREIGLHSDGLATSMREAVLLSRRIGAKQLGIPLNAAEEGKLMMVREPAETLAMGGMDMSIIGPFKKDLSDLRKKWQKWLREQATQKQLKRIRADARRDERNLGNALERFIQPLQLEAEEIGNRKKVTTPNLASLMLLVEEDGKSVLLTGDGHGEDVIKGLGHHNKLDAHGRIHVNVLKMLHHGSEFNASRAFFRDVTADHYVFCGNGDDENPDKRIVQAIIDARIGDRIGKPNALSKNDQAKDRFRMFFNSSPEVAKKEKKADHEEHMKQLKKQVTSAVSKSGGRMRSFFLQSSKFTINV